MKITKEQELENAKKTLRKCQIFLIMALLLIILNMVHLSFAYTTEENLLLNKISINNNLTTPEQVTLFNLLDKPISNETNLVYAIRDNITNNINKIKENQSNQFDLVFRAIDNLKVNISQIVPVNDQLAIAKQEEENIKTYFRLKNQDSTSQTTFDWKKLLNPTTTTTKINNISLENYYTKTQIDDKFLKSNTDLETKLTDIKSSINLNNQTPVNLSDYITKTDLAIAVLVLLGVLGFFANKYLMPEINKNKVLLARVQALEKKLESKSSSSEI